jgi:DNA-binding NtrC family response regulator
MQQYPSFHSRGAKVAVLDDDQDAAASIAELLVRQGLNATAFTSTQGLVAATQSETFAAFVLDWLVGDTTAASLIAQLRAKPALVNAPMFLLSGNLSVGGVPSDPELAQAIRLHRLHYRVKPCSAIVLARELLNALGKPAC